ncbi:hypothetical protein B0H16DRAFT_327216 [Mycena metata]|uniref:Uncharacterized protein n=1 Tax=Mycena metata TaxID=1033252 RepID=A0AAD7HP17_9AGAR|nr:hypothetical protein B0H16DRAFT_327216 [Mycena metata]
MAHVLHCLSLWHTQEGYLTPSPYIKRPSMPTLPVHFRPRPWGTLGTEWLPYGLDSRPFHPDFEPVPSDATERREFQCSATLESYLVEFYHEIRPKLQLPSLEGSPDLCALFASHKSTDQGGMIQNLWAFRVRVMDTMLAWFGTLPADTTAQVVLGTRGTDQDMLAMRLSVAAMLSMRDELIELKVWVSIFTELNDYFHRWAAYVKDLEERHSKSHFCTYRRSPTLPVHFRPRPFWPTLGTEWLPYGLDSRPFHMDFERVPAEATERREFQCSATLESYLVEFHHDIRPKLQLPSLEGSPDLCALLASHQSDAQDVMIRNIYSFKIRLMHAMLAWLGTMPADAIAQVQLGSGLGRSDEETLAMRLTRSTMLSMRDELIELKVWASIFTEIDNYFHRWAAYVKDLEERHSKPHVCTLLLKLTGIELRIYSPKPEMYNDAASPPNISRNSKLIPNAENRSRPAGLMRRRPIRGSAEDG